MENIISYQIVIFYCIFTCVYFPIIISVLYFTDNIYYIGKYAFFSSIIVMLVAECIKYFVGILYFMKKDCVNNGKYEERHSFNPLKKSSKHKVKEIIKCLLLLLAMLALFCVIAVLFGAEIYYKHEETFMFSILLSTLTIFPACLNLGSQSVLNLLFAVKPGDVLGTLMLRNLQLTLFGSWLGAFVIPLDWDRPWQEWPIPCSSGAMLGFTAANLLMLANFVPKLARMHTGKSGRKLR